MSFGSIGLSNRIGKLQHLLRHRFWFVVSVILMLIVQQGVMVVRGDLRIAYQSEGGTRIYEVVDG